MADASLTIDGVEVLKKTSGEVNLTNTNFVPNSSFMFRNKIINGGMQIAQRGTQLTFAHDNSTAKPSSGYHLDRFAIYLHNTDEYECTVSQYSMTAAEINTTGHAKALKLLTVDAESSGIANDEYARFHYKPEGQDVQDFLHGTASAKTGTLSFWVKSSITGNFGFNLYRYVSSGNARSINLSYTINAANTWEKKTISIVGDTGGATIPNANTAGLLIIWQLAAGSNFHSTASSSWSDYASTRLMNSGKSDAVITTAGADWYLTGVQLEIGSVATPFEHRPIGMELSLCQRYFQIKNLFQGSTIHHANGQYGGSTNHSHYNLQTTMRSAPTVTISQPTQVQTYHQNGSWTNVTVSALNSYNDMIGVSFGDNGNNYGGYLRLTGYVSSTKPTALCSSEL